MVGSFHPKQQIICHRCFQKLLSLKKLHTDASVPSTWEIKEDKTRLALTEREFMEWLDWSQ